MGFMDDVREDSKKYGGAGGGKYFEFQKGINVIRLLVKPKIIATHFFGPGVPAVVCVGIDEGCTFHKEADKKPSIKLATYVIDRKDDKVKLAELPLSLSYGIDNLQDDEEYAFSEFPMPYDLRVKSDPDNKDPKMKYQLTPARENTPITPEEQTALDEAMKIETPEQYVEKKKARQKEKGGGEVASSSGIEYPKEDINPDDIPF